GDRGGRAVDLRFGLATLLLVEIERGARVVHGPAGFADDLAQTREVFFDRDLFRMRVADDTVVKLDRADRVFVRPVELVTFGRLVFGRCCRRLGFFADVADSALSRLLYNLPGRQFLGQRLVGDEHLFRVVLHVRESGGRVEDPL